MIKALIWNVRGIGGKESIARVKNLSRMHNIKLIVLIEPLIASGKISSTASKLGFSNYVANCSNKIWIMWNNNIIARILSDFPQSDFNTITTATKRRGGNRANSAAMDDFNNVIADSNLNDIGFTGTPFTWYRSGLWKCLDRLLFNNEWISMFPTSYVEHLSRTLSDHSPLLLTIRASRNVGNFAFRFQNMWLTHVDFKNVINSNWNAPIFPNNDIKGMFRLWSKLSR
ncbi:threonine dehydratase [Dendrobium catenatum]|uniref:Threonine dehydratase n=1 Tax=Dendrobium catenatum TaxID=906689 RepID=A0A2I0VZ72_9ASPA|nr:threonine dehydratase [Dendrobium catenatum]